MLAYRSISSTISLVRLQSHSFTVHLVLSRISSLSSVEIFFIFNPLYKSISSLALMVKGVCTSVTRPSVFLNKRLITSPTASGLTCFSSTYQFYQSFKFYWQQSLTYQLFAADRFPCLEFLLMLVFFVIRLMIYLFWFFQVRTLSKAE